MAHFIPNNLLTCNDRRKFTSDVYLDITKQDQLRGSSVVERGTHNPEVGGAKPSPASLTSIPPNIILGYN